MELLLTLPNSFKFVEIILTIKHSVFNAEMRVGIKIFHQILPYGKMLEVEFLAMVANRTKVATGFVNFTIDGRKHKHHLLNIELISQRFHTPPRKGDGTSFAVGQLCAFHFMNGEKHFLCG